MSVEPTTRAHIVLPTRLLEQLDALVGPRHRSEFIAEALAQSVQRASLQKALDAMNAWPDSGRSEAEELEDFADAADEVRRERRRVSRREQWLQDNWYSHAE